MPSRPALTRSSDSAWIGGPTEDVDRVFRQLFHFTVTHLLAHHQRYVVHAAGLVAADGNAYLVVGGTGQGKSTLSLAALASGWGLLADDLVVIRRRAGGLEASGIARSVASSLAISEPSCLYRPRRFPAMHAAVGTWESTASQRVGSPLRVSSWSGTASLPTVTWSH